MKNINKKYKNNMDLDSFCNKQNSSYLFLFQKFNDIVSNIENEKLKNKIIYSYLEIENFLFRDMEKERNIVMSKIYDTYLDLKAKNKDTLLLFKVRYIFYIFR